MSDSGSDLDERERRLLRQADDDPGRIVNWIPRQPERLGYYSVVCLLFNRMIGALKITC
jgi:hypothetical protein